MQAKEPILSLLVGTALVCAMTLPYFWGIGRSLIDHKDDREVSLLKFLALPFAVQLFFTIVTITFTNIWDVFYTELPSTKLINIFWGASAIGATNEWVKAAYSGLDFASMILYYLVIAIPFVNAVAVALLSSSLLKFKSQDAWGGFKRGAVKIVGILAVAAILTIFYQKTINLAMFGGQSLNFKEWGTASSSGEMQANFYKRIAKMGVLGKITTGERGGSSSSSSSVGSGSQNSLLDAYFNNK